MRSKILLSISIIFIIGFSSALTIDTVIEVNSVPDHTLSIFAKDEAGYYTSALENINKDGTVTVVLPVETLYYTLTLNLKKDGETIYTERLTEDFASGETLEIDFYPEWYQKPKPEINETENSTEKINTTNITAENLATKETNTTHESSKISDKLTGFAISINGKTLSYIGGIIILVLVIWMVMGWRKKQPKKEKKIKITKLSEINQKDDEIKSQEERIAQAKETIKNAEEELKKLKNPNPDKIEAAKRRLIEDQKELMRLRKETSENQ